ncbi:M48 family metallopeptidase [Sessilibacter corallicola]|uniref:M48 family metallopeptidase n=1 Tax=Sessilibacter corallicola TaxID=2904075 RepID=UPI001E57A0D2|nr:SprT family zinc-dependent metalloprotease [Sessilibacter corallicola]MCE2030528.1 M48 family metallopeptidase [Sessilibacter corallicola]
MDKAKQFELGLGPDPRLPFEFELKRSARRKTLEVRVASGNVSVRAPQYVSTAEIKKFLSERSAWVQQKLAEQQTRLADVPVRTFDEGSPWPLMDSTLSLRIDIGSCGRCKAIDDTLCVQLNQQKLINTDPKELIREQLEGWYRAQAQAILLQKSQVFADNINKAFQEVRVRKTKTRWGHCTSKGVLQYNWLILLAPEAVVDYLVAHEVSHLKHFNHSRQFWQQVEQLCPDYLQHRKWLKNYGFSLWF